MIFQINPRHAQARARGVRVRAARESRPISIQWKDGVKIHSDPAGGKMANLLRARGTM